MEELINLLHTGGYSCTIANGGKIRTFTQRGVADLYDLLTQEPEFLKGALIAYDMAYCQHLQSHSDVDTRINRASRIPFFTCHRFQ